VPQHLDAHMPDQHHHLYDGSLQSRLRAACSPAFYSKPTAIYGIFMQVNQASAGLKAMKVISASRVHADHRANLEIKDRLVLKASKADAVRLVKAVIRACEAQRVSRDRRAIPVNLAPSVYKATPVRLAGMDLTACLASQEQMACQD